MSAIEGKADMTRKLDRLVAPDEQRFHDAIE
jgi:hypothetical protein